MSTVSEYLTDTELFKVDLTATIDIHGLKLLVQKISSIKNIHPFGVLVAQLNSLNLAIAVFIIAALPSLESIKG